jgi:inorganic pyrophosphatase
MACISSRAMKLGKRWIARIAPSDDPAAWVPIVNEISRGSCCKYRLDKTTGQLSLARALPPGLAFPTNYGFIPHTRSSADDEETDVLILSGEPLLPLTLARVRIVGGFVLSTSDQSEPEERLVAAALEDPAVDQIHGVTDLDPRLKEGIEKFTRTYKQNQGIDVSFDGWLDREAALERLRRDFKAARKRAAK